jgi:hypothetical protein
VLAIDASGSISNERLTLEINGYAHAIGSDDFLRTVRAGRYGRVALTLVGWSGWDRQQQMVPWSVIDDFGSVDAFVITLLAADKPTTGYTSISGAIDYSADLIRRSGYDASRSVIDISGDGRNNDGRPVNEARDAALAAGITINGLPFLGVEPGLDEYYRDNVIGGRNAFTMPAKDQSSFADAVMRKLLTEVAMSPRIAPVIPAKAAIEPS